MVATPNLALNILAENQAGKYLTINDALYELDAVVQISVISAALSAPSGSPAPGDCYIVAGTGSGAWLGHDASVAYKTVSGWNFYAPKEGFTAYNKATKGFLKFNGTAWVPQSGTYTPTLTNIANLDSSSAFACQYAVNGNVVTVSGKITLDPTANATPTKVGISLPIASTLTADTTCAGAAACPSLNSAGGIYGDSVNHEATLEFVSQDTASQNFYFTFAYQLL